MSAYESWGRYPKAAHTEIIEPAFITESLRSGIKSILPYGQGRSYGDACLNTGGALLSTRWLNRLIEFDPNTGILRCDAGVTLEQILEFSVPRGFFLPVTPGTKYVSVGGALANDIHGKNHHVAGTFGRHVLRFELLRSDGGRIVCSPSSNADLFSATIGGLGLTGLVTWVEFKLRAIKGPYIDMESIKFHNIDEFLKISSDSDEDFEYTVAWLDCVNSRDGRGLFMRGNHSPESARGRVDKKKLVVPIDFPSFALNSISVSIFNLLYFHKQRATHVKASTLYDPFFYPLDAVLGWNRIYGKRGFFQFQCVVPESNNNLAIREVLNLVIASKQGSFLAVLKKFGEITSPGMLSFPRAGITLALDFANQGERTLSLLRDLDLLVAKSNGAIYPAKDATMSAASFKQYYPRWEEFSKFIDPAFSSSFWRRVR